MQDWKLTVDTQDITKDRLVTFMIDNSCGVDEYGVPKIKTVYFYGHLIDNPCAANTNPFTNLIADYSRTHTAHTPPLPINLGIDNGFCKYEYELLNADLTPSDETFWTVMQPTFTPAAVPLTPDVDFYGRRFDVTNRGSINFVEPTNIQQGVYPMILRVKSLKAPTYDFSFIDVLFTLTIIPWPCTPLITPPTLQTTYNYYIKDPPVPMDIPFAGVNNNDCFF